MPSTPVARRGMVTAPHHLASAAGVDVLRDGGTAIEAMIAMAGAIAAAYPHMTGLGGDGFWLIAEPGRDPVAIDACGATGQRVTPALYPDGAVPPRGPLAANTVAGTLSGWAAALEINAGWGGRLPLDRLLADAIDLARGGIAATDSQARTTAAKRAELEAVPGFARTYLDDGAAPAAGAPYRQPRLAATLERVAADGPDSFYRGDLARSVADDLETVGAPIGLSDLESHYARRVTPLSVALSVGTIYNLPPPTQGLASLMILGLFDRLGVATAEGYDHVHGLVEATKRAFRVRDRVVRDPDHLAEDPAAFLTGRALRDLAREIDPDRALPWPESGDPGDTVWMGAIDGEGRAVSFIQSLFWEFGSGVVLPETGLVWQNRGSSLSLDPAAANTLAPGRKPFHTLNPALARLADGRTVVYGTMGGEGQPQTQAAVLTRYAWFGQGLQRAVAAPRWLLGRTWGAMSTSLKIESGLGDETIAALCDAGHVVETVSDLDEIMGHAGALALRPDGFIEGAADPRADGAAAGF
ncbi:MAG: gamma-glutamyltransferase [Azospirillaceae bacterium]